MNALPSGFLHTDGAGIVGRDGRIVRLAGVNWYGFECEPMVAGGLHVRTVDAVCATIADLGFNHVRLPYCDEMVLTNPRVSTGLEANPRLSGLTAIEVMDEVIAACGRHRLRVVLDNHRSDAGWSAQGNGLWYSQRFSEADWLRGLWFLADRYQGNDIVIGFDLRNEPGSPPIDPDEFPRNGGALWGEPDRLGRPRRDWAAAAERAGDEVLTVNPNLLIFVEGVRGDPGGPMFDGRRQLYWPGGNLCGVRTSAGRRRAPRHIRLRVPGQLVYSVHDYGPDMYQALPWCRLNSTAESSVACRSVWDQAWGFIARQEIAPIYVGEFGTRNGSADGGGGQDRFTHDNPVDNQGRWFTQLVDYMNELRVSWAYWPLNGDQPSGVGRDAGQPDWYGVLTPDWTAAASPPLMAKLALLQR